MRLLLILPVLSLASCSAFKSVPKKEEGMVIFEAPAEYRNKQSQPGTGTGVGTPTEAATHSPTAPGLPRPSGKVAEGDQIRIGDGVNKMPSDGDFKPTNPNLTRKPGDGAVIAKPPVEKPVEAPKKAPKE